MNWIVSVFILISLLTVANDAYGRAADDTYRRVVNFEWEPIDSAKYYEIEIRKRVSGSKTTNFKTEKAEWTGKLQVGRYEFRLRSLDKRKVPGEWSGFAELDVLLETVKPTFPASDAQVKSGKLDTHEIKFEWAPSPGAKGYAIEVFNENNESIVSEKLEKTNFETKLAVAQNYSWKVKAISEEGIESETTETNKFTLQGPKLEKVKIEKPDNEFVREVKWNPSEKADAYDVTVALYNPELKKWQKFKEFENVKETSLNFEADWKGGQYRVIVKARAPVRATSDTSVVTFPVRTGDRGPAAEYVLTMRKSIDRVNGYFAQASWFASSISLTSQYRSVLGVSTSAVTGTARVGMGLLRSESPWGFIAIMDAGGYIFENSVYNFFGLELSAVRRQNTSDRAEIRYLGGIYTREFPAIWFTSSGASTNLIADPSATPRKYGKGNVMGPHAGVEYWYSMTPKFGIQTNAHVYLPMTASKLPNGGKLSGTEFNYSLGALASYRYSSQLTGLVGVNYKQESYSYTDSSDSAGWNSGILTGRSSNNVKTSISGIFLNLMAEYSF